MMYSRRIKYTGGVLENIMQEAETIASTLAKDKLFVEGIRLTEKPYKTKHLMEEMKKLRYGGDTMLIADTMIYLQVDHGVPMGLTHLGKNVNMTATEIIKMDNNQWIDRNDGTIIGDIRNDNL